MVLNLLLVLGRHFPVEAEALRVDDRPGRLFEIGQLLLDPQVEACIEVCQ